MDMIVTKEQIDAMFTAIRDKYEEELQQVTVEKVILLVLHIIGSLRKIPYQIRKDNEVEHSFHKLGIHQLRIMVYLCLQCLLHNSAFVSIGRPNGKGSRYPEFRTFVSGHDSGPFANHLKALERRGLIVREGLGYKVPLMEPYLDAFGSVMRRAKT